MNARTIAAIIIVFVAAASLIFDLPALADEAENQMQTQGIRHGNCNKNQVRLRDRIRNETFVLGNSGISNSGSNCTGMPQGYSFRGNSKGG